jgi:hypothetical protein
MPPAPAYAAVPADALRLIAGFLADPTVFLPSQDVWARGDTDPFLFGGPPLPAASVALLRSVCRDWRDAVGPAPWCALNAYSIGARSSRLVSDALLLRLPVPVLHPLLSIRLADQPHVGAGLRRALGAATGLRDLELRNCRLEAGCDGLLQQTHNSPLSSSLSSLSLVGCEDVSDVVLHTLGQLPALERVDLSESGELLVIAGSEGDGTVLVHRPLPPSPAAPVPTPLLSPTAITGAGLACLLGLDPSPLAACGPVPQLGGPVSAPFPALRLPPSSSHPSSSSSSSTLTTLRLAKCGFVTDAALAAVLVSCPALRDLDLTRCVLLDGSFLRTLCSGDVAPRLTRLVLSAVGSAARVADSFGANAAAAFGGLKGEEGDPPPLPAPSFPRLRELDVSWCPWVKGPVLPALFLALAGSPSLARLSFHACTSADGPDLARHLVALRALPSVVHLDVGQVPSLTDDNVAAILSRRRWGGGGGGGAGGRGGGGGGGAAADRDAASNPLGPSLPRLSTLDISGCPQVSTLAFAAVGEHCPSLTRLRSRTAVRVGGAAVRALVNAAKAAAKASSNSGSSGSGSAPFPPRLSPLPPHSCLPGLTHLDLWRCIEVDDDALRAVASCCPNLAVLDLDGADVALSDAGVVAVAKHCPRLVHLSLANGATSNTSLRAIAAHCPRLAHLDLSGGLEYTSKGLCAALATMHRLQTLRLVRCAGVTDAVVATLAASCPHLRALSLRSCGQEPGETDVPGMTAFGGRDDDDDDDDDAGREPGGAPPMSSSSSSLTPAFLGLLAPLLLAPRGRLVHLELSYIPCLTVDDLFRFVCRTALRDDCALTVLRCVEGMGTEALESFSRAVSLVASSRGGEGGGGGGGGLQADAGQAAVLRGERAVVEEADVAAAGAVSSSRVRRMEALALLNARVGRLSFTPHLRRGTAAW